MKLRGKLFFLLLLVAFVPVLGLVLYEHAATGNLGAELVEREQNIVTVRAAQRLLGMIRDQSAILRRSREVMKFASRHQTRAVEDALAAPGTGLALQDAFDFKSLPVEWRKNIRGLLIFNAREGVDPCECEGLSVFAESVADTTGKEAWRTAGDFPPFGPRGHPSYRALSGAIEAGQTGIVRMPVAGRDSLVVHGPVGANGLALLLVIPVETLNSDYSQVERMITGVTSARLRALPALAVLIVMVVALAAFLGARSVTRPVISLVGAANRLATGDFSARAECGMGDEIGELACAFNELGPQLEDRFRLQEDMDVAKEIQQSLLPKAMPEIPGFEVAGETVFCDETGGDYFDFLDVAAVTGDDSLAGYYGIFVGDVAGHGIGAALQMVSARALLHGLAQPPLKLSRIVDGLNQGLTKDLHQGRFMTLFCGILAGPERNLYWVSAGHDPAIVYDLARDEFSQLGGDDIPLGVDAEWRFQEKQTGAMKPGRIIVIGTDGIWETRNAAGEMYGKDRLLEVIREHAESPAEIIMTEILVRLDMFRGQAAVRDDVTVVVIKTV